MLTLILLWNYEHALGIERDVEHARAMAMASLLIASGAMMISLTRLRSTASRVIVAFTLTSLALLVQVPILSQLLHLRPLHGLDWLIAAAGGLSVGAAAHFLAAQLRDGRR